VATVTHTAILEATKAHLLADAAFGSLVQVAVEPWPRRQHKLASPSATLKVESPRFSRYISTHELEWIHPLVVLFIAKMAQIETNVVDILGQYSQDLRDDFLAVTGNPLRAASDAGDFDTTPSRFQRVQLARFDLNPVPLTDHPKYHGVAVAFDVFTCDLRGA